MTAFQIALCMAVSVRPGSSNDPPLAGFQFLPPALSPCSCIVSSSMVLWTGLPEEEGPASPQTILQSALAIEVFYAVTWEGEQC